jgi:hypothetical protein
VTSQWHLCSYTIDVTTVAGHRTWASGAGEALQATIARIKTGSQYGANLVNLQLRYGNFIQTYACRDQRGSSSHSEHSHPVAFDAWPGANPLSNSGVLYTNFDLYGGTDGEKFLHSIMDPLPGVGRGIWQWGGGLYSADVDTAIACFRRRGQKITSGHTDAMHFELDNWVTSSFVSSYDWDRWTLGEEDDLTPEDKAYITAQFKALHDEVAAVKKDTDFITANKSDFKRLFDFMQGVNDGMTQAPQASVDTNVGRAGFRLDRKLSLRDSPVKPI